MVRVPLSYSHVQRYSVGIAWAADAEEFFLQCDPTSENLVAYVSVPYGFCGSAYQLLICCIFCFLRVDVLLVCTATPCSCLVQGNADSTWSVALPAEEVPPELPEPCLGSPTASEVTRCCMYEYYALFERAD